MRSKAHLLQGFPLLALLTIWLFPHDIVSAASYSLVVDIEGVGTVLRNPTNSVYPEGSVVTVTAIPSNGWFFARWTRDEGTTSNPLNVLMSSNKSITAVFNPIPTYTLTVSTQGMGMISLSPAGSGPFISNSIVTLTATPSAGWVFAGWTGDANGSGNPIEVTMDRNKSVQGIFAQVPVFDVLLEDAALELGDSVTFKAHALGSEPLSYQWWLGGTPLAAETNTTLELLNVQLSQEGLYSVVASNDYGSATNSASLTIGSGCTGTNVVTVASEAALRDAVNLGGLVRLCFNGTISLSNTIEVAKDVVLDARNRNVVISGNDMVRLFSVSAGVTFAATNLVLVHGKHTGAAGGNFSASPGEGGAVFCDRGIVRLVSCTISNNTAVGGMGGINGISAPGRGGAIAVHGGALFLESSTVMANSAEGGPPSVSPEAWLRVAGDGLGGAVYVSNATAHLTSSRFGSNRCLAPATSLRASALGGALCMESSTVTITNNHFLSNAAVGSDAATVIISDPLNPGCAYGGAIAVTSGSCDVLHCWVSNNLASGGASLRRSGSGDGHGGAVFSTGNIFVSATTFQGNKALAGGQSSENPDARGGAVCNLGVASFDRCAIISNSVVGGQTSTTIIGTILAGHGLGGGVYNAGEVNLTNTTIALNSAEGGPEAVGWPMRPGSGGWALGGGLYNTNGTVYAFSVTIASNFVIGGRASPTNGLADGANVANGGGELALGRTILGDPGTNNNARGTITDLGYNISSDGSANFNSGASFNFTNPRLLPLADNGGPTPTMALQTNSPAIDLAVIGGSPTTDQRGLPRPSGLAVDVGAFELQVPTLSPPSLTLTRRPNGLLLSFAASPAVTYELQGCTGLTNWGQIEVVGPYGTSTEVERLITGEGGSKFFRLLVR